MRSTGEGNGCVMVRVGVALIGGGLQRPFGTLTISRLVNY